HIDRAPLFVLTFFFSSAGLPRNLHSFPTRRSSDLARRGLRVRGRRGLRVRRTDVLAARQGRPPVRRHHPPRRLRLHRRLRRAGEDRKSTRLNSSHVAISYAVFCLKKKT